MSALPTADQMTLEEISSQRNARADRWRVYGWCDGRICFINRFKDEGEAHRLVRQLQRRYDHSPARFWYAPHDRDDCSTSWRVMRAALTAKTIFRARTTPLMRARAAEAKFRRALDREASRGFVLGPPQLRKTAAQSPRPSRG